ncbi:hypothetical protein [Apilactobacillus xinyiensis]|uniref:hypothetical protein n=1 Tax=Apilactobacillus xinyiensis TaxID=2841032 RepID=UPI00200CF7D7|nr:hypothetical protein [Apilactobacillus xinyiensis]MCL0330543.1 hypothetical protein [Apilactobacillus xinyiensis]
MFDDMVKSGWMYVTQSEIDNYFKVNFISKDCYDYVTNLRKQQNSNPQTTGGEQPQQ